MSPKRFRMWESVFRYLWIGFLLVCLPIDILILLASSGKVPFPVTIVISSLMGAAYLSEREFFILDSDYLFHQKSRKILWKIKVSDIEKVYIKKPPKKDFFLFYRNLFFYGFLRLPPHGTQIAFVFRRCDILRNPDFSPSYGSIKPEEDRFLYERVGSLSLRKCHKLCKRLGLTPVFLE